MDFGVEMIGQPPTKGSSGPGDPWARQGRSYCPTLPGPRPGRLAWALALGKLKGLSQTDVERKFLHTYLRYVKDRQFPMLLPQVRVGIAERRRADFIAFVPLQFWKFKWVAIELDAAHPESKFADDQARDKYYEEHKYDVLSLRPGAKGYLEEVKSLVEEFETWMNMAETDASDLATEARVLSTEPPGEDLPF